MKNRSNLYNYADGSRFAGRTAREVFTDIMKSNTWIGDESVSGTGSSLEQTAVLIEKLPGLLQGLGVRSMLDIPCGDFNWMQHVEMGDIRYTGADIVPELVEANRQKHLRESHNFLQMDLIRDDLGVFDLIFCRDCLVHLSFADIFAALANITRSGSRYLMTTTFPDEETNQDIDTGGWRPLNFGKPPFRFPPPLFLLNEQCTELDGAFADKSMGVWEIGSLPGFGG